MDKQYISNVDKFKSRMPVMNIDKPRFDEFLDVTAHIKVRATNIEELRNALTSVATSGCISYDIWTEENGWEHTSEEI